MKRYSTSIIKEKEIKSRLIFFHLSDWPKKVIMPFIARLWRKSPPRALLVGVSMGTTAVEGKVAISIRRTNAHTLDLAREV